MEYNYRRIRAFSVNSFTGLILLLLITFFYSSCRIIKPTNYFESIKKDTTIKMDGNSKAFEEKIVKNDVLEILITSSNPTEDILYNSAGLKGYLVNSDGNIHLHKIGSLSVAGLTRKELKKQLEKELEPYLKDVVIAVNFMNHRVSVLGSVESPQVFNIPEDKIALLELLAMAGDVGETGDKKNILVIRDSNDVKTFNYLNLENHSLFTTSSPFYYIKSGDIVYVEQDIDKAVVKLKNERTQRNLSTLSIILSTVSITLVIIDRFK